MRAYVIGLTGGIASGKSRVGKAFAALGAPVIDADAVARDVLAPGSDGLADVVAHFGPQVLGPDGALDRAAMRAHVFQHSDARRRLEEIVHPRVRERLHSESATRSEPYVLVAIPLLAEDGGRDAYPWLDRILLVDAPVAVQLQRLCIRDGIDEALALRMIEAQATRHSRLAIADDVLVNDGHMDPLGQPVAALDAQYRHLSRRA